MRRVHRHATGQTVKKTIGQPHYYTDTSMPSVSLSQLSRGTTMCIMPTKTTNNSQANYVQHWAVDAKLGSGRAQLLAEAVQLALDGHVDEARPILPELDDEPTNQGVVNLRLQLDVLCP